MITEDNQRIFVDTNILVYANVTESPFHELAVRKIRDLQLSGARIYISRQVIREYLVTMTRSVNFTSDVDQQAVINEIDNFTNNFTVLDEKANVTKRLLGLLKRYLVAGKQIHDANIVATMLAYNIPVLLTHNVCDFRRFSDTIHLMQLVA